MSDYLDSNGLRFLWNKIKGIFVEKETGKGLSANDFTNTYKSKLDGIATGANNYTLPKASGSTLGGVKVGEGLEIDSNGVLSAASSGGGTFRVISHEEYISTALFIQDGGTHTYDVLFNEEPDIIIVETSYEDNNAAYKILDTTKPIIIIPKLYNVNETATAIMPVYKYNFTVDEKPVLLDQIFIKYTKRDQFMTLWYAGSDLANYQTSIYLQYKAIKF